MGQFSITAELRTATGKGAGRRLRSTGFVPSICYGAGNEPQILAVSAKDMVAVLRSEKRTNSVLDLVIGDTTQRVMIKDFQLHPARRTLVHVDFYALTPGKTVVVDVPVDYQNTEAHTKIGSKVSMYRRSIKIRCLPENIPTAVAMDASVVKDGETFQVKELELPAGLEVVYKSNFALIFIKAASVEAVEAVEAA